MSDHAVVSQQEWLAARKQLLLREKEMTHLRDAINKERLALPWVKVDKEYVFETREGKRTLADLFDGRSQLVVYHFMFAPDWEAGCEGCSFMGDHLDGTLPHLTHHDVTLVSVSRAPLQKIDAYKKRMGWKFPWVSANSSDFNYDFHVSFRPEDIQNGMTEYNYQSIPIREWKEAMTELPGMSSFYKDESGDVFHTYSSYARGSEEWLGTLMILDRAPLGRNEDSTMGFIKRHDEYENQPKAAACCHGE